MSKIISFVRDFFRNLRIRRAQTQAIQSDTRLIAQLAPRKTPTLQQWKYLPRVLSRNERIVTLVLVVLALASIVTLGTRLYLRFTIVVPARGGSYTEALVGTPRFLNPIIAQTNDVDLDLTRLLFSGLFRHTETLAREPDLAERYVVSDDKKKYTFTLKQGLRFDDGEPLTARDVAFTIRAIQDPEWRSPLEPSMRGVAVNILDDATIELALQEPFAPFLDNLTFGILPEHVWADIPPSSVPFAEENVKPIGAGPFRVESLKKTNDGISAYTLSRNPQYHGTSSFLDRVVFKFFPDTISALDAVKNKQADGTSGPPRSFDLIRERDRRIAMYTLNTSQYMMLFFKSAGAGALVDASVRGALVRAIDRVQLLDQVFANRADLALGMIPKGSLGYDAGLAPITRDIDTAMKALKSAGWKELAKDGYTALWEKQERERLEKTKKDETVTAPPLPAPALERYWEKNGTILTMTLTTVDTTELAATAAFIKQAWETLGIPTDIITVSNSQFSKEVVQPRAYATLLTNIVIGADPNPYPLWHSSQVEYPGLNLSQFQNKELDGLLEAARKEDSPDARATRYQKIQTILHRELPAFPMVNPWYLYAIDRNVQGVTVGRMLIPADRFATIASWYVKTKRIWK